MSRRRMIDPEFFLDEDLAKLSPHARLLYIGSWTIADDNTFTFPHRPEWIKAQIFPYENVKITQLLHELVSKEKFIIFKNGDEKEYIFIKNMHKHQRIEKPSKQKYPAYSENSRGIVTDYSENTPAKDKLSKEKIREVNVYVDFEKQVHQQWNQFCDKHPSLSKIKEITESRRKHLKERFGSESFRGFEALLKLIEQQPFLIKGNPNNPEHKDWKVSFDWLIENDTNYIKVIELRYKNKVESEFKSADSDCKVCYGTGWAMTGEGGKVICRCRINK